MKTSVEETTSATLIRTKKPRKLLRVFLILALIVLVLGGIALGGVSVYFSNQILQVVHYTPVYTVHVTDVTVSTVTLDSTFDTLAQGEFQIEWPAGAGLVGKIVATTSTSVTRQLLLTTAPLYRRTLVFFTRYVYEGQLKNTLKLAIQNVNVPDSLGLMPAWYVAGQSTTWAILVHGRGSSRDEGLRVFQPLAKLGLPLLSISYRNDIGAPASPDGFDHLGDSEWQDLQAAAQYALAHGAQHLLLYGWSQGGAVVEEFIHRSTLAHDVQALILDSPILNWRDTLAFQAQRLSVPGFVASLAEGVSSARSGINFDTLDQFEQPQPAIPMLLFQGIDDTTTPVSIADTFAREHPDFVTYIRVPDTNHTNAWNTNPQKYDQQVAMFASQQLHLVSNLSLPPILL